MNNREKLETLLKTLQTVEHEIFYIAKFQASGTRYDLGRSISLLAEASNYLQAVTGNLGVEIL